MPWTVADVDDHIKDLSDKQKEVWVEVANKALARCQEGGGNIERCEASAIRQANTVAKGVNESMTPTKMQLLLFDFLDAQTEPDVTEASDYELHGDIVPLVEKAIRDDGTARVKLIQPGWGASGFYSQDVLKRDGPKAFPADTQMFFNHMTAQEERERPEGDVTNLVGKLTTAAEYDDSGVDGPGLYADAKIYSHYKSVVEEVAPDIGVSIRAWGKRKVGEAEGKKGPVVERILAGRSVDFVTRAGAGGKVVELFEAARSRQQQQNDHERSNEVDEKEAQALREANAALMAEAEEHKAEIARLKEAQVLAQAGSLVRDTLAGIEMPAIMRERLTKQLSGNPVLSDGELDKDAFVKAIKEAANDELAYLAKATGKGRITGMGASSPETENSGAKMQEAFELLFSRQGHSPDEAKKLAALAAR